MAGLASDALRHTKHMPTDDTAAPAAPPWRIVVGQKRKLSLLTCMECSLETIGMPFGASSWPTVRSHMFRWAMGKTPLLERSVDW